MKRWVRNSGIVLTATAALAAVAAVAIDRLAEAHARRGFDVPARPVPARADAAGIERGRYLYVSRGCADCHGADGSGRLFIDDGAFRVRSPNITPEPGSAVAGYTAADWDRSVRHGVGRNGQALRFMPSEDYNQLTDHDFGALVGFVRQLPARTGSPAIFELPLPLKVMAVAGLVPDAADRIDHGKPPPQAVPEGITVEHGAYVAHACTGCHGALLSGGRIPGAPPDWPPAPNLTPGEKDLAQRYARIEDFTAMLRTGRRPDGSRVSQAMPFGALAALNATDVAALHVYLRSLPERASGGH